VAGDSPAGSRRGHPDEDRVPHVPRDCITAYLENGGKLEHAQQIAAHESPRTRKLYDRTRDQLSLGEIERIAI